MGFPLLWPQDGYKFMVVDAPGSSTEPFLFVSINVTDLAKARLFETRSAIYAVAPASECAEESVDMLITNAVQGFLHERPRRDGGDGRAGGAGHAEQVRA